MMEKSRYRGLSIVAPFILIGLGIVIILQQYDVIHWNLLEVALRLWPLVLIAIGADIIIGRRSYLGAVVSLIVMILLLLGGIMLMGSGPEGGNTLSSENVQYALKDATSGQIRLSIDAGKLQLDALPETSTDIIQGTVHSAASGSVVMDDPSTVEGKTTISIRSQWPRSFVLFNTGDLLWDLRLTPLIPLDLDCSMGAGEIEADLSALKVQDVGMKIGAGHLWLKLPSAEDMDISVNIGAGAADIYLPANAPVQVDCKTGIGSCNLPNGSGFWTQTYTSPEYDQAQFHIHLDISLGVGEATVSWQ
jgi:LiaI-LiaF-like transmembrane region